MHLYAGAGCLLRGGLEGAAWLHRVRGGAPRSALHGSCAPAACACERAANVERAPASRRPHWGPLNHASTLAAPAESLSNPKISNPSISNPAISNPLPAQASPAWPPSASPAAPSFPTPSCCACWLPRRAWRSSRWPAAPRSATRPWRRRRGGSPSCSWCAASGSLVRGCLVGLGGRRGSPLLAFSPKCSRRFFAAASGRARRCLWFCAHGVLHHAPLPSDCRPTAAALGSQAPRCASCAASAPSSSAAAQP